MKKVHIFSQEAKQTSWGDGEWVEEEDLAWFIQNDYSGFVQRQGLLEPFTEGGLSYGGHFCGYVFLPPSHFLYGKKEIPEEIEEKCNVHGGITFSDYMSITTWTPIFALGFDCGHCGDIVPSMHKEELRKKNIDIEFYPLFSSTYKNIDFALREAQKLVQFVHEVEEKGNK